MRKTTALNFDQNFKSALKNQPHRHDVSMNVHNVISGRNGYVPLKLPVGSNEKHARPINKNVYINKKT